MGGSCYDRDVISTSSSSGFSAVSAARISSNRVDSGLLPRRPGESKCRPVDCFHKNPIVCILDVTGSMGDWSKVIYDKLPLFFGEIEKQGYLGDAAISFAAVGDAHSDDAPLQVCQFSQSTELDDFLARIWLEGGGGGQNYESYELMAYYYLNHCLLKKPEQAFLFVCGDEGFYPKIDAEQAATLFGDTLERDLDSTTVWNALKQKFNVFHIHKEYSDSRLEVEIVKQWRAILGERVLKLSDPKAIIDVMLGAVALTSGTRNLPGYLQDMKARGQTPKRLQEVALALQPCHQSTALAKVSIAGRLPMLFKKS